MVIAVFGVPLHISITLIFATPFVLLFLISWKKDSVLLLNLSRHGAMYQIRTDLALETQEKMQEDHVELKGVRFLEKKVDKNLTISTVVIETENGAKAMGKPKGTYITIEASNMDEEDEDYHREISVQLAEIVKQLTHLKKEEASVLIVGLGNREVTPDALGPRVVDNLFITRHIINEYGKYAFGR